MHFEKCTGQLDRQRISELLSFTGSNVGSDGGKLEPSIETVFSTGLNGEAFFVFTLVSTIGYGNYHAHTAAGQMFSSFILLVGFPLQ